MAAMDSEVTKNNPLDSAGFKTWPKIESSVTKFEISLMHSADDVHYRYLEPGGTLNADVIISLASPIRVSTIDVELKGEANVTWRSDEDVDKRNKARTSSHAASCRWFQSSELHVDDRQTVNVGDDELPAGLHQFAVSFQLPRGLPSSFCGRFGSVKYELRASFVDRSSMSARCLAAARYSATEPVLVRRHTTAPDRSTSPMSTFVKLSRRLFAGPPFICVSGLLRVDFIVDNGVEYQLGDDIRVSFGVINNSPRAVVGVDVVLVQVCEFRAQRARRRCVALVSRRRDVNGHLAVVYGDTHLCDDFRLNVPTYLPESHLDGCDVIDVNYELRFTVEVSGCRQRLKKRLPVIVSSEDLERRPRLLSTSSPRGSTDDRPETASYDVSGLPMSNENIEKFHRPMRPGETKQNIAYKYAADNELSELNVHPT